MYISILDKIKLTKFRKTKLLTSFAPQIIPKLSPSENITHDEESRISNDTAPVTKSPSLSTAKSSVHCFKIRRKYNLF